MSTARHVLSGPVNISGRTFVVGRTYAVLGVPHTFIAYDLLLGAVRSKLAGGKGSGEWMAAAAWLSRAPRELDDSVLAAALQAANEGPDDAAESGMPVALTFLRPAEAEALERAAAELRWLAEGWNAPAGGHGSDPVATRVLLAFAVRRHLPTLLSAAERLSAMVAEGDAPQAEMRTLGTSLFAARYALLAEGRVRAAAEAAADRAGREALAEAAAKIETDAAAWEGISRQTACGAESAHAFKIAAAALAEAAKRLRALTRSPATADEGGG